MENPHRVSVIRANGTRLILRFKNKAEATRRMKAYNNKNLIQGFKHLGALKHKRRSARKYSGGYIDLFR